MELGCYSFRDLLLTNPQNLYRIGGCSAMLQYMPKFNCAQANPNWFSTIPKKADFFSPLEWSLAISLSKEFEPCHASHDPNHVEHHTHLRIYTCNHAMLPVISSNNFTAFSKNFTASSAKYLPFPKSIDRQKLLEYDQTSLRHFFQTHCNLKP